MQKQQGTEYESESDPTEGGSNESESGTETEVTIMPKNLSNKTSGGGWTLPDYVTKHPK